MNKLETIDKLNNAGIYQLRKGETLKDALDYLDGKLISRKGYQYKTNSGRLMDKNEIVTASNKEAFSKSVTSKEFLNDSIENIDDISEENDLRDNKNERGIIANCYYCGICIRVDCDNIEIKDYPPIDSLVHCNDCMNNAIMSNCM